MGDTGDIFKDTVFPVIISYLDFYNKGNVIQFYRSQLSF